MTHEMAPTALFATMAEATLENLGLAQATVATLGTVMIIGLGFLQRPSRASLLWSLSFVLAMVATWITVAGEALGDEVVRRTGLGLMLGAPVLIWSGLRARRGVRAYPWLAGVHAVGSAAILLAISDVSTFSLAFRFLFFASSVYAGLVVLEIRRSPDRHERLVIPLLLVSGAFVVLGAFTVFAGFLFPTGDGSDLVLVRILNTLGMLIYLVCAIVTLLFFSSVSPVGVHTAASWPQFTVTASDRLRRAREAGETSWALLVIRLDDPDDIRSAAGEAAFGRIAEGFDSAVRASFPAEADIGRDGRGRLVILICRPGPVLREHVRSTLRAVTEMEAANQLAVQLSASVGWAPADVVGHDFDALLTAAERACQDAAARGGDRWERVGA